MMRMMPKMSVSPQAMKNRIAACENAFRDCATIKPAKFIWACQTNRERNRNKTGGVLVTPPNLVALPPFVARRQAVWRDLFARIGLDDLRDRFGVLAWGGDFDDEALVLALVIAFAHQHRPLHAG